MASLAAGSFSHSVTFVISSLSGSRPGLARAGSESGPHDSSPPVARLLLLYDHTHSFCVFILPRMRTHTHTDPEKHHGVYN